MCLRGLVGADTETALLHWEGRDTDFEIEQKRGAKVSKDWLGGGSVMRFRLEGCLWAFLPLVSCQALKKERERERERDDECNEGRGRD